MNKSCKSSAPSAPPVNFLIINHLGQEQMGADKNYLLPLNRRGKSNIAIIF
jgi:hypothetical protein